MNLCVSEIYNTGELSGNVFLFDENLNFTDYYDESVKFDFCKVVTKSRLYGDIEEYYFKTPDNKYLSMSNPFHDGSRNKGNPFHDELRKKGNLTRKDQTKREQTIMGFHLELTENSNNALLFTVEEIKGLFEGYSTVYNGVKYFLSYGPEFERLIIRKMPDVLWSNYIGYMNIYFYTTNLEMYDFLSQTNIKEFKKLIYYNQENNKLTYNT